MPRASKGQAETTHVPSTSTEPGAATRVSEIKLRLKKLEERKAELIESQIRIDREKAEVVAAIEQAEAELEAAVAAPVAGGEDPTLWLPDELLLLILVHVAIVEGSRCSPVCRRWWRLCQDRNVKEAAWEARWVLCAEGKRQPRLFESEGYFSSLCAGVNGTMYCGTKDGSIEVRSETDGSILQTLTGHAFPVDVLIVGLDGTLYSGSTDGTVRVWSEETGAHIRTLEGHTDAVYTLAVNATNLFSGSDDGTIRVWQCSSGDLVHTLTDLGRGRRLYSLALGTHDQLYSGSEDGVIRVWSATDFTHIRTLAGHRSGVWTLVFSKDGTLFSGSGDGTICVWSGTDGTLLRTLDDGIHAVTFLALTPNGTLFSASREDCIQVWRHGSAPLTVWTAFEEPLATLAFTRDGNLWAVTTESIHVY